MTILSLAINRAISAAPPDEGWELQSYTSSKLPIRLIGPQSDASTPSWAKHRHAYTGELYTQRVNVANGAWPYKFEFVNSTGGPGVEGTDYPTGATIVSLFGSTASPNANYGLVLWTPSGDGGPHTVRVRATGQDKTYVTSEWTVTASTSTSTFAVFDTNDTTSTRQGTKAEPYNASDWGKITDGSLSGKQVIWRGGTHGTPYQLTLASNDALVHFSYPGETAVLDLTKGGIVIPGGCSDTVFTDMTLRNTPHYDSLTDVSNSSITEGATGVYTVNCPSHGLTTVFSNTGITEIGSNIYEVTGTTGFGDRIAYQGYLTITGSDVSQHNGVWPITATNGGYVRVDMGATGYGDSTTHGQSEWGFITIHDASSSGGDINGDYAIEGVDTNNFKIYATTGITVSAAGTSAWTRANPRGLTISSANNRWEVSGNNFDQFDFTGWKCSDNVNPFMVTAASIGNYAALVDNAFTNNALVLGAGATSNPNGGPAWDFYGVTYWLVSGNTFSNINTPDSVMGNIKQNMTDGDMRYNRIVGPCDAGSGMVFGGGSTIEYARNESRYNLMMGQTRINYNTPLVLDYTDTYWYRNTIVGTTRVLNRDFWPELDRNVVTGADELGNIIEGEFEEANHWEVPTGYFEDYTDFADLTLNATGLTNLGRSAGEAGHEIL